MRETGERKRWEERGCGEHGGREKSEGGRKMEEGKSGGKG